MHLIVFKLVPYECIIYLCYIVKRLSYNLTINYLNAVSVNIYIAYLSNLESLNPYTCSTKFPSLPLQAFYSLILEF